MANGYPDLNSFFNYIHLKKFEVFTKNESNVHDGTEPKIIENYFEGTPIIDT